MTCKGRFSDIKLSYQGAVPWEPKEATMQTFNTEDKIIAERADFSLGKRYLSDLIQLMTLDFIDRGGKITVCKPAFAAGCETPIAVRQAIRAGR